MSGAPKKGFSLAEIRGEKEKNDTGLRINSTYALGSAFHMMAQDEKAGRDHDDALNEELFGEVKKVKLTKQERQALKDEKMAAVQKSKDDPAATKVVRDAKLQKAIARGAKSKKGKKRLEAEQVVEDEETVGEAENPQFSDDEDEQEAVTKKPRAKPAAQKASKNPVFQRNATTTLPCEDEDRDEESGDAEMDGDDKDESDGGDAMLPPTATALETATQLLSKRASTAASDPGSEIDDEDAINETVQDDGRGYDFMGWANNVVELIEAPETVEKSVSRRTTAATAHTDRKGEDDSQDEEADPDETDMDELATTNRKLVAVKATASKAGPNSFLKQALDSPSRVTRGATAPRKRRAENYVNDENSDDSSEASEANKAARINGDNKTTKPSAKAIEKPAPKEASKPYQGAAKRTAATPSSALSEVAPKKKVSPAAPTRDRVAMPNTARAAAALTDYQKLQKAAAAERAYQNELKASAVTAAARPTRRAGRGTLGVKQRGNLTTHESGPFFSEDEDEDNQSDGADFLGLNKVVGSMRKPQAGQKGVASKSVAGGGQRGVATKKRAHVSDDESEVVTEGEMEPEGKVAGKKGLAVKKGMAVKKQAQKKALGDADGRSTLIW